MASSREEITELARIGSLAAISALSADPADALIAFALCTDDDVSSVFHVGCTENYMRTHAMADVLYLPNEWLQTGEVDPPELRSLSGQFQQRSRRLSGDAWAAARDADFAALADGLARARVDAGINDTVWLTVMSTDPSAHMSELEEGFLLRLNPSEVVRKWRQWRLGEASRWLVRLEAKPEPLSYADQDMVVQLRAEVRRFGELLQG